MFTATGGTYPVGVRRAPRLMPAMRCAHIRRFFRRSQECSCAPVSTLFVCWAVQAALNILYGIPKQTRTDRFFGECDFDLTVREKGGNKHVFTGSRILI